MKSFTEKERHAAEDYLMSIDAPTYHAMTKKVIVNEMFRRIDQAEGWPVRNGGNDKYLDAKDEIIQCMIELNKSIKNARTIGLKIDTSCDDKGIFALSRIYKDF